MVEVEREVKGQLIQRYLAVRRDTQRALREAAKEIAGRAEASLTAVRSRPGYHGAADAKISVTKGDIDYYVNLDSEHALSIEFGRANYRDPETNELWGGTPGTFILTEAAGLEHRHNTRGPRKRRKRGWVTR